MFEVEFYKLPDGRKPVKEFLDSLEPKMRAKALYGLSVLEEYGNALREPYPKPIGEAFLSCGSSSQAILRASSISSS